MTLRSLFLWEISQQFSLLTESETRRILASFRMNKWAIYAWRERDEGMAFIGCRCYRCTNASVKRVPHFYRRGRCIYMLAVDVRQEIILEWIEQ